jgi:hypothetical protein
MTTLAIDPGPVKSGFVRLINGSLAEAGHYENEQVLAMIHYERIVLVEWVQFQGKKVGNDVFRTAQICGDYRDRCRTTGCQYHEMTRSKVSQSLLGYCGSKTEVKRWVIQTYPATGGGKVPQIGTDSERGPLYKMREGGKHSWDALALFLAARKEGRI